MLLLLGRRPQLSLPDARLRQFQSSSWASQTRSDLELAASFAHPGGNATGSSNSAPDLSAKLLGTFAQLVPGMSSVGVVVNPANPGAVAQMDGTQQAVHALGLQSQVVNAGKLEEYERAFARLKIEGVNGVLLLADPSNDTCVITRRLPERDGEFEYRIKSVNEPHERVVRESQLTTDL